MLLTEEVQKRIDSEVDRLFAEYSRFLLTQRQGALPILEQIFIAGKVAGKIGPKKLERMTEKQLKEWVSANGLVKSQEDAAYLSSLERQTSLYLGALKGRLETKIRDHVLRYDKEWTRELILRDQGGVLQKSVWTRLRESILGRFVGSIGEVLSGFRANVDGFLQTIMAQFFQTGQESEIGRGEYVYKVPRPTACPHCMRLHIDSDGNYRTYRLGDVVGNSNVGLSAPEWQFTIGPVHPNCYCILHRVEQDPPVRNAELAAAYELTMGNWRRSSAESAVRYRRLAEEAEARLRLAQELER